jgi:hypothetical protein
MRIETFSRDILLVFCRLLFPVSVTSILDCDGLKFTLTRLWIRVSDEVVLPIKTTIYILLQGILLPRSLVCVRMSQHH